MRGVFPYICALHDGLGMTGTVIVHIRSVAGLRAVPMPYPSGEERADIKRSATSQNSSVPARLQQSREYTLQEFMNRSWWERTTEWLMLPFRSQL